MSEVIIVDACGYLITSAKNVEDVKEFLAQNSFPQAKYALSEDRSGMQDYEFYQGEWISL